MNEIEKCLLLNRIKCLSEEFLVKEVYNTAMENGWPGLHREVNEICEELMINDLNYNGYSKKELDQIFKLKQKEYIYSEIDKSKKLHNLKFDNFDSFADYFKNKNIKDVRNKFRIRTNMVKNIPTNFRNLHKYDQTKLLCEYCPCELTQQHLVECPSRVDLREDLDLMKLDDVLVYIKRTVGV